MRKKLITSFCIILFFGIIFSFSTKAQSAGLKPAIIDDPVLEPAPTIIKTEQYAISIPEPTVREVGGKAYYEIKGFGLNTALGLPLLPYKTYYFVVPFNAKDVIVTATTDSLSLGIIPNIEIFRGMTSDNVPASNDAEILAARAKYTFSTFPDANFRSLKQASLNSHRLIRVGISPLIQNLTTNELIFNKTYTIKIQYTLDNKLVAFDAQMAAKRSPVFEELAKEIIYNYPKGQTQALTATQTVSLTPIASVPIKYAIITLPGNESVVQPLADWKTKKGIPAKVYTTTEIETAHPEGADLQEKIRLFITNPSPNSPYNPFYSAKFDWLLIAGEQGGGMPDLPPTEGIKLPSRYVGAAGNYWTGSDNEIVPADYYYADCAGGTAADTERYDWDTNDNSVYGEMADDIDWLPDTYVGRIPSNESAKLSTVVNKIIAYEKTPAVGSWTRESVLCGAKADSSTDTAFLMQMLKQDFLDPAGLTSYQLYYLNNYPRDVILSEANFKSYVSAGRTFVEWMAHGSNNFAYLTGSSADGYFVRADTTQISNSNKRSVVYVAACTNGMFDYHGTIAANNYYTIGDSAIFGLGSMHDWAIAFMGAARSVYYWPGWSSPAQGGAHGEQYRFNEEMFSLGKYKLGEAFYGMKLHYVTDFNGNTGDDPNLDGASRKDMFATNLLGDPEMEIWTDTPKQFNATYPTQVYNTPHDYTVTITDGTNPVQGAQVTLYKSGDAFGTGQTDINGQIIFTVSTATTGTMNLTVTKHNFVPSEKTISVVNERVLTISSSSGGTTNPAPGVYSYGEGSSATVNAIANAGYDFNHWELDGTPVGSANPYSVLMDANHTLNAVFTVRTSPSCYYNKFTRMWTCR